MKVYNEHFDTQLNPCLREHLSAYRADRAFDPQAYLKAKAELLNRYLRDSALKSCVVAVSGGIDSAVVLGIAVHASQLPDSPIERIVPVCLPVMDEKAATNQWMATRRGQEVTRALGLTPEVMNLAAVHGLLKYQVDKAVGVTGEGWAAGQLVSYLRTPALYYITSLLSQAGQPGILLGTTNMDEGAYLGYFGKASDGLVDVQVISDLHKSEVFALGRALGLPASVLAAVPTGDMYDGRVDEEVFGAPYDFVELFLHVKAMDEQERIDFFQRLDEAGWAQYKLLAQRLENLHAYNLHKYLGKSPAVHLDLIARYIPGGWDYSVYSGR